MATDVAADAAAVAVISAAAASAVFLTATGCGFGLFGLAFGLEPCGRPWLAMTLSAVRRLAMW